MFSLNLSGTLGKEILKVVFKLIRETIIEKFFKQFRKRTIKNLVFHGDKRLRL